MNRIISAAAGAFLLVAGSASAITVAGPNPNSSAYMGDSSSFGSSFSGVAELSIVRSDLGYGVIETCSGTLLADGFSILTSAHCIADAKGIEQATAAYVTFNTPNGVYSAQAVGFKVDPAYDGSATSPNDVAVLTLAAPVSDAVTRYGLYTGDASNQVITLAGYGFGGTGVSGYNPIAYPFGTLRVGENQYDPLPGSTDLMFGFDDGSVAHDALGPYEAPPYSDLGMGANEAFIAPGDAGGPSFINGQIAGVHSYAERLNGGSADIDGFLDSSFGEVAADASVAYNLAFIQSSMLLAPEPRLMIALGVALVAVALVGDKRKPH